MMKNYVLLLSLIFSSGLWAQVLVNFSENNPSYERAYLLGRLALPGLSDYSCSQTEGLFTSYVSSNANEDSLRLQSNGKTFVYKVNQNLATEDNFLLVTQRSLDQLFQLKNGRLLVSALMKAPYPVTIIKGLYRFDPSLEGEKSMWHINESAALAILATGKMNVEKAPYEKLGTGGRLRWNPDQSIEALEKDGVTRKAPTLSSLAHEMYHAYDSVRGFLDMRFVKWEGYEFNAVMEYRAVYLENLIRQELGQQFRYGYTAKSLDEPGLLDPQGLPVFFAAPCF